MFNPNWNSPRMGMRGPDMWQQQQMQLAMQQRRGPPPGPPAQAPQPLIRPGGGYNSEAMPAQSTRVHPALSQPTAPPPQQHEMMKLTSLQSQALQYQQLMKQQYQQYNQQMIEYEQQYKQWHQQQKSEESNTPLSELHKRRDMFVKQLVDWETQFNSWREEHSKHPDKDQFKRYQDQWQQWQTQMKDALIEIEKQIKERENEEKKPPMAPGPGNNAGLGKSMGPGNNMGPTNTIGPGNMGPRGRPVGIVPGNNVGHGPNPHMGPRGVDMGPRGIDMGPRGVDMGPRGIDMGPRGIDMGPRGIDMGPRGPNMREARPGIQMGGPRPHISGGNGRFSGPEDFQFRPDGPGKMERFGKPRPDGPHGLGGPEGPAGNVGERGRFMGGMGPNMGGPRGMGPGMVGPGGMGLDGLGGIDRGMGGPNRPGGIGRGMDGPDRPGGMGHDLQRPGNMGFGRGMGRPDRPSGMGGRDRPGGMGPGVDSPGNMRDMDRFGGPEARRDMDFRRGGFDGPPGGRGPFRGGPDGPLHDRGPFRPGGPDGPPGERGPFGGGPSGPLGERRPFMRGSDMPPGEQGHFIGGPSGGRGNSPMSGGPRGRLIHDSPRTPGPGSSVFQNRPQIHSATPPPGINPADDDTSLTPEPMDIAPPGTSPPHPSNANNSGPSSQSPQMMQKAAAQLQLLRQQQEQLQKLQKMQEMSDRQRSSNQGEPLKSKEAAKGYPKPLQPAKPDHSTISKPKEEKKTPAKKGYPKPKQPPKHQTQVTQPATNTKAEKISQENVKVAITDTKKESDKKKDVDKAVKEASNKKIGADKEKDTKNETENKAATEVIKKPDKKVASGSKEGKTDDSKEGKEEVSKEGKENVSKEGKEEDSKEEKEDEVVMIEEIKPAGDGIKTEKTGENDAKIDESKSEEAERGEVKSAAALEVQKKLTASKKESPFAKKPLTKDGDTVDQFGRTIDIKSKRSNSPSDRFGKNSSTRKYRGRTNSKSRSRSRSKDRSLTRPRERSRDRSRAKSRERSTRRSRSKERSRARSRDRSRERSRKRSRSRSRESSRAKKTDRGWKNVDSPKTHIKLDRHGRPYEAMKKDPGKDKERERSRSRSKTHDTKKEEKTPREDQRQSSVSKDIDRIHREEDLLREQLAKERSERLEKERLLTRYSVEEELRVEERLRAERLRIDALRAERLRDPLLADRLRDDPLRTDRLRDELRADRLRDDPLRVSRLRDDALRAERLRGDLLRSDRLRDDPRYDDRYRDDYYRRDERLLRDREPPRGDSWYRDADRYRMEDRYRMDDRYRSAEAERRRRPEETTGRERYLADMDYRRDYGRSNQEPDKMEGGRMEGGRMVFDYSSGSKQQESTEPGKAGFNKATKVESIDYSHGQGLPVGRELKVDEYMQELSAGVIGDSGDMGKSGGGAIDDQKKREAERFPREPERFPREPDRFPREPERFPREPERFPREPERFPREPERFPREPERFPREPDGTPRGAERYPREPERFPREPERFPREPEGFPRGAEGFGRGREGFQKEEGFSREAEDFRGREREFDRGGYDDPMAGGERNIPFDRNRDPRGGDYYQDPQHDYREAPRSDLDERGPHKDQLPVEEEADAPVISTNFPDEEEREFWGDPKQHQQGDPLRQEDPHQQDHFQRDREHFGLERRDDSLSYSHDQDGKESESFGFKESESFGFNETEPFGFKETEPFGFDDSERDESSYSQEKDTQEQFDYEGTDVDERYGYDERRGYPPDEFDRGRDYGPPRDDFGPSRDYPPREDMDQRYHIPPPGPDDYHDQQNFPPEDDYYDLTAGFEGPPTHSKTGLPKDNPIAQCISIDDILNKPGRLTRPKKVLILMRGPPGSGKTYVSRLIKEKEMLNGGATPRMLCLDDYFSVEVDKMEVDPETNKKVKVKVQQYEYEEEMESIYQASLLKSFKKTIDDGFFDFLIVDAINDKLPQFEPFLTYGKNKGFECYIAELMAEASVCLKRNIHSRTEEDISQIIAGWQQAPVQYTRLDVRSILQDDAITEVEMEDFDPEAEAAKAESQEEEEEAGLAKSRWEVFTEEKLDKLDGVRSYGKRKHSEDDDLPAQSMEEYFNLNELNQGELPPGAKRVRWADIEERKDQMRKRAVGFVIGQTATDWEKITDDNYADKALNRTKYF